MCVHACKFNPIYMTDKKLHCYIVSIHFLCILTMLPRQLILYLKDNLMYMHIYICIYFPDVILWLKHNKSTIPNVDGLRGSYCDKNETRCILHWESYHSFVYCWPSTILKNTILSDYICMYLVWIYTVLVFKLR